MTKIIKRSDGYWIIDLPLSTPDCGPYTKLYGDDADEAATAAVKCLEQFFIHEHTVLSKKLKIKRKKH